MAKGNQYFTGDNGKIWINDINYIECFKAEAKKTINYEEIPDPDGGGNVQIPMGYSIEGSLSIRKVGNEEIIKQLKEDKDGNLNIDIIIKEENPITGIVERTKYIDCTFNEVQLSQFEKRAKTEIELSFKARTYEVLQ